MTDLKTPSPKRQLKRKTESAAGDAIDVNDEEALATATATTHTPTSSPSKKQKHSPPSKAKAQAQNAGAKGTAWIPEKRLALLDAVVKESNMTLDKWAQVGKIVGKSDTQAKDQWRQVLLPKLRKAIADGHV